MFYYLNGDVVICSNNAVAIDCSGVAYMLTVSSNTFSAVANEKKAKLYTYMAVREDGVELFGFYTLNELDAFKLLTGVSGVGSKAAISILSAFTPSMLAEIILNEDTKSLTKAQGIGAKTAARIVLELKDKMKYEGDAPHTAANAPSDNNKLSEAQNALMVLGYTRTEAQSAIRKTDTKNLSLEEIITKALQLLMK